MFERWGRVVYRRRRLVLVISLLAVVFAAVWGTGVFSKLQSSGGFTPANSESQQASNLATAAFGRDAGDVVVLYSSPDQAVRSPGFRSSVTSTLADLPHGQVLSYQTYWSTRSPRFISASGRETYAVLELAGADDAARIKSLDAIKGDLAAPGLQTQTGGFTPTEQAINKQVTADIGRAEGFSMPVLLIVMLIIFGSLAAASLPLAIGGIAILGSFTALRLLTLGTTVSIYSINITTILGLGLAIDYGLFLVSRFREELRAQPTVEDAVARTVATAGRTVAVSGITVATALASLMLFPETFLRSMGYGGVATVLVDMLAALTVMPALLAVLGPRVNALRIRRLAAGTAGPSATAGRRPRRGKGRWAGDGTRGGMGGVVPPGELVPDRAQRDAPPCPLRGPDRGRAARARRAVPAGHLGRDRRDRAAVRGRSPRGHRGAEPRLSRPPHRADRVPGQVHRPGRGLARPAGRARVVPDQAAARSRSHRGADQRCEGRHRPGGYALWP